MNQNEINFLNLENELLGVRKKLNDLIYEYNNTDQYLPESANKALYRDKISHLETEIQYLNNQLQTLKNMQFGKAVQPEPLQSNAVQPGSFQGQTVQSEVFRGQPAPAQVASQATPSVQNAAIPKSRDYEKMFGRNFMGIFASVLIFISLIIFATLILPYLTDTMKLCGLYLVSVSILFAGLLLYKKNADNKFYVAIIGCGAGSLYLSLLLSNLYFKVIGDIALYVCILVWAVFVKYLARLKNLVFTIIGQSGILIATILGTALCVHDKDAGKFLVLTVFYLISSCVYSGMGRAYLLFLTSHRGNGASVKDGCEPFFYEDNLCNHICKSLNIAVFVPGFVFMEADNAKVISIFLLMAYLLLEYFFSYKEICRGGVAFQILTTVNAVLFVCLFHATKLLAGEYSYVLLYVVSIAILLYVNKKDARYRMISEVCCFVMIYVGCFFNAFTREHLYAYLTAIPFLIYGGIRGRNRYLTAGIVYTVEILFLIVTLSSNYFLKTECLVMVIAVFVTFLCVSKGVSQAYFQLIEYPVLCLILMWAADDAICQLAARYNELHPGAIMDMETLAYIISFLLVAVIHLILSKTEYFGKGKNIEIMMLTINAVLMLLGCNSIYQSDGVGKLPVILITVLLFCINSQKLLNMQKYAGYYIAFKYTVLMVCILDSFDMTNYVISISLLLFAIASIVVGFHRNTGTFRLYGLVLSMISIFKLIMIDIKYDSTVENAVSFFVSGVLCFIISFIYHRIDSSFKRNNASDSGL